MLKACSDNLFHHHIKWIIITGQFFGLLPVNGVNSEKCNLTFNWFSKKVFYSEIIIFVSLFLTATTFYRILYLGYNLTTFSKYSYIP